jgi:hypothetical protein
MNTYEASLHVGIGDLVCSKCLLMSLKNTSVKLELNQDCFAFRGPNYDIFAMELAKSIFVEPMFSLNERYSGRPRRGWFGLWKEGMRGVPMSLAQSLGNGNSLGKEKYVCLNTKVRGFSINRFLQIKDRFSSVLTDLSKKIKIVLLGERVVERNKEYQQTTEVYSIYPMLPKINFIDLTIPALGITAPTIGRLMQDCKYMSESMATINIGLGGNVPLSTSVSKRSINILGGSIIYEGMGGNEYEQLLSTMNPGFSNHDVNEYLNVLEALS